MPRSAPLIVLLLLTILAPRPADAHQRLIASAPANGDTLSVAPSEIRLTFNLPVEPALARLTVLGPRGPVQVHRLALLASAPEVLVAALDADLAPGAYTVSWMVTSSDGHPVNGEFAFVVAGAESAAAAEPSQESGPAVSGDVVPAETPPAEPSFSSGSPAYAAVRWLLYAALIAAIGAVAFATVVVPGAVRRSGAASVELAELAKRRAATLGMIAAAAVLFAAVLRLFAQMAAVGAGSGTPRSELAAAMLGGTAWGAGWIAQMASAAVLLILLVILRSDGSRRALWGVAALAAMALGFTPALSGHAVAVAASAVIADGVHVLAASVWIGSLLCLITIAIPLTRGDGRVTMSHFLGAFSPIALLSAAVLGLTGLYAATLHLPDVAALATTAYGRTLALKLILFLLVIASGAYNWRRASPAVESSGDAGPLRGSAIAELIITLAVLAVTAVLVATPPP